LTLEPDRGRRTLSISQWVPIALSVDNDALWVDWGNIGETEFKEAFFDETIRRWAQDGSAQVSRTGIEDMITLATDDLVSPRVVIFHSSRCGSTLVGRMLPAVPGMQVISEPAPVNSLLLECPSRFDRATCIRALRNLVRMIGRPRHPRQQQFALKTSSWNIRYYALFRAAFPTVPMVWMHRKPVEVMASLLRNSAGWMGVQQIPVLSETLFGIPFREATRLTRGEYCAHVLASLFVSALSAVEDTIPVMNYADLPQAVWTQLLPLLSIDREPELIDKMRQIARFDAKATTLSPFCYTPGTLSREEEAFLDRLVNRPYERIESRRMIAEC
jgi:hypothetical protein